MDDAGGVLERIYASSDSYCAAYVCTKYNGSTIHIEAGPHDNWNISCKDAPDVTSSGQDIIQNKCEPVHSPSKGELPDNCECWDVKLMTINKFTKVANFILSLIMFYLLDKSLMFIIDIFASTVGRGRSGYSFILEKIWDMTSFFIVSVLIFMLLDKRGYFYYRNAFISVFVYFFLVFLVKANFFIKNKNIISSDDLYFRVGLDVFVLCMLYVLLMNLRRVLSIYEFIRIYLSR